jgi:hypothetical protein
MSESGDGCAFFPMHENCKLKCSGFCFDQVDACLKIAQLDLSLKHRASFLRTADHWNALAKACDGELHPWKSWCYPDTSPGSDTELIEHLAHVIRNLGGKK